MPAVAIKPERIFRALSDPTRLRILNLLMTGEVCVCHIVEALRIPQPTASRHLAYLRRAGLVVVRKDGVWSHYSLSPAESEFDEHLRQCLECCADQFRTDAARLTRCVSCC